MAKDKMFARSNDIHHPAGVTITTPLLVPSFSSKGFGIDSRKRSEIFNFFNVAKEILTESMLISAYDIAHNHLPKQDQAITEITFVDSGGYETSNLQDLSAVFSVPQKKKTWLPAQLKNVYDQWSPIIPAIFVNYDDLELRHSIEEQIDAAEDFLFPYKNQLWTILLKPETDTQRFIKIENVLSNIKRLRNFHIIGFTEKELGNSILDRMSNISRIRMELDENGITSPIHIFGSLDPVSSPLYFLAGAEIFDGLTWLRYGYYNGLASYTHNTIALEIGINNNLIKVQAASLMNNYNYLIGLQNEMKMFLNDGDFSVFRHNFDFLEKSYNLLRTRNRRLK